MTCLLDKHNTNHLRLVLDTEKETLVVLLILDQIEKYVAALNVVINANYVALNVIGTLWDSNMYAMAQYQNVKFSLSEISLMYKCQHIKTIPEFCYLRKINRLLK